MDIKRYREMDAFLKYFAKIYEQNPNIQITSDTLYNGLENYGFTNEEMREAQNIDFYKLFNNWINRYQNASNLKVFHTELQRRFLQFQNRPDNNPCIKLYISIDANHIEECVNRIFDFFEKNNINSVSKVADKMRSDNIVLRINNKEEAVQVINYINSDPYIKSYAHKTNPFMMREGVVGIAYDDYLSYNSTLCTIMANYLDIHRNNKTLANVSADDFYQHMKLLKNDIFRNRKSLIEFTNTSMFQNSRYRFNTDGECILNFEQVISCITKELNPNFSLQEYMDMFTSYSNKNNKQEMVNYYNTYSYNEIISKKALLDSYIEYAIKSYDISEAPKYLQAYINGQQNAITRTNNYRNLFTRYLTPGDILRISNNNIYEYMNTFIESYDDSYFSFLSGAEATLEKYDIAQLEGAIEAANREGTFKYFTNGDYQYRDTMKKNVLPNHVIYYCQKFLLDNGYEITNNDIIKAFSEALKEQLINRNNKSY